MATIVSMPKWGLAMKTGLIVEWLKQPGETIQQGEPIVEIESEKATNEVEAPASGTLRWVGISAGDSAPVGEPLAIITAADEVLSDEGVQVLLREEAEARRLREERLKKPAAAPRPKPAAATGTATRTPASAGGRVNASPAARRLAQELGVDLTTLVGTGPGGMIGREDVLNAAEANKAQPEEAEEGTITIDGIATHYIVAGPTNAPRVVFVHGLGGSVATWALNLPAFAQSFRICALDLVGAGDSDKPATDYSVSSLANFLAHFLDALGPDWQRVNLVGHSLGGAIALAFAQQHPERVEKLVLVDSAGLGPEIDAVTLDLMRSEPTPESIRSELVRFFAQSSMAQQSLVNQLYQQRTAPGAHPALRSTLEAAFGGNQQRMDLRKTLAAFPGQTLTIWGDVDSVLPVAHAEEAKQAQQGRVEVFASCGHCPHIERSDAFNDLVTAFLSNT